MAYTLFDQLHPHPSNNNLCFLGYSFNIQYFTFMQVLSAISRRPLKHSFELDPSPSTWTPLPAPSRPFELKPSVRASDMASVSPAAEEMLEVTVKQLKGGSTVSIKVTKFETIDEFKRKVAAATGVAAVNQRLVLNGKGLTDGKTLMDFDIKSGSSISLLKKAGGADKTPAVPTLTTNPAATTPAVVDAKPTIAPISEKPVSQLKQAAEKEEFWRGLKQLVALHITDEKEQAKLISKFGESYLDVLGGSVNSAEAQNIRHRYTSQIQ